MRGLTPGVVVMLNVRTFREEQKVAQTECPEMFLSVRILSKQNLQLVLDGGRQSTSPIKLEEIEVKIDHYNY